MRWLLLPSFLAACSSGFDKETTDPPTGEPSTEEPAQEPSEPSTEEPAQEPSEPAQEPSEPSGDPNDEDNDGDGFSINDGDCDDEDEDVNPDAEEIPGDGIDNDCEDGDAPMGANLNAGDLIITEIMNNPSAVDDAQGEWFEIYNNTNSSIDLTGLIVRDMSNSESFEVTMQLGFSIEAGSTATFGNSDNPSQNGGIEHNFSYSDFNLSNSGDEIVLEMNGVVVDMVDYGQAGFPDPNGASMSLAPDQYDATANDNGENWCASSVAFSSGDFGTPNESNNTCAPPNPDMDGDGYDSQAMGGDDCDDNNPAINPGAIEDDTNGVDDDCDGTIDEPSNPNDLDGDGYDSMASGGDDCDDNNPDINPGALEVGPNNIDENCDFLLEDGLCNDTCAWPSDGACDDGGANATFSLCDFGSDCSDCGVREDIDADGAYDAGGWPPLDSSLLTIADCDDNDAVRYPDATDIANDGIDQDCDGVDYTLGLCDDTCNFANDGACDDGGPNAAFSVCDFGTDCSDCGGRNDSDQDGFYDDQGTTPYDSTLEELMDCDDADALTNPDGIEIADDGIDQDCDGADLLSICDDTCQYANDGQCDDGGTNSDFDFCDLGTDCTDCGSRIDEDEDGYDDVADCDDREATVNPGIILDDCNGVDNDCDGAYDEDFDATEPSDASTPIYIGDISDTSQSSSGYLTYSSDIDAFSMYIEDETFDWYDDIRCDVTVPSGVDAYLTLLEPNGNTADTAYTGMGGTASVRYTEGFGDDSGTYTLVVETFDGMSCSSYTVFCTED